MCSGPSPLPLPLFFRYAKSRSRTAPFRSLPVRPARAACAPLSLGLPFYPPRVAPACSAVHQVAAADGWQRTHRGQRALWFFQRRKKWFRFDEYAPGSTSFAGRTADGTAIARNKDTDALAARPRGCQRLFGSKGVGTGSAIAAGNVETRGPKAASPRTGEHDPRGAPRVGAHARRRSRAGRLITVSYYFNANILISGKISRYLA